MQYILLALHCSLVYTAPFTPDSVPQLLLARTGENLMVKKYINRFFYSMFLMAAWGLLAYSVLFSGFSTTLADYYGGGNGLYCFQLLKCDGSAGCTQGGSLSGCDINCTGGGVVKCMYRIN